MFSKCLLSVLLLLCLGGLAANRQVKCSSNNDCGGISVCEVGLCTCEANGDCGFGEFCRDDVCTDSILFGDDRKG
uniref:Uncharacterized protein n=1 Tax=Ditylenchus dipsaci TaxID=166011 RepID=A0A915DLI5_9BILA